MNPADRPHFHGRVQPMDKRPARRRMPDRTSVAEIAFWIGLAALGLFRIWSAL